MLPPGPPTATTIITPHSIEPCDASRGGEAVLRRRCFLLGSLPVLLWPLARELAR